jgi:hypothetical protein
MRRVDWIPLLIPFPVTDLNPFSITDSSGTARLFLRSRIKRRQAISLGLHFGA